MIKPQRSNFRTITAVDFLFFFAGGVGGPNFSDYYSIFTESFNRVMFLNFRTDRSEQTV